MMITTMSGDLPVATIQCTSTLSTLITANAVINAVITNAVARRVRS